jgi:hypothetical protein
MLPSILLYASYYSPEIFFPRLFSLILAYRIPLYISVFMSFAIAIGVIVLYKNNNYEVSQKKKGIVWLFVSILVLATIMSSITSAAQDTVHMPRSLFPDVERQYFYRSEMHASRFAQFELDKQSVFTDEYLKKYCQCFEFMRYPYPKYPPNSFIILRIDALKEASLLVRGGSTHGLTGGSVRITENSFTENFSSDLSNKVYDNEKVWIYRITGKY